MKSQGNRWVIFGVAGLGLFVIVIIVVLASSGGEKPVAGGAGEISSGRVTGSGDAGGSGAPASGRDPRLEEEVRRLERFAKTSENPVEILMKVDALRGKLRGTPYEDRLRNIEERAAELENRRHFEEGLRRAREMMASDTERVREAEVKNLLKSVLQIAGSRRGEVEKLIAEYEEGRLDVGLVGRWTFDGTGKQVLENATGKSEGGKIHGAPVSCPDGGKFEGCLEFDGVDDYIDLGDVLRAEPDWTVAAWIRTVSLGERQEVLSKEGLSPNQTEGFGYELSVHPKGEVEFGVFDGTDKWPAVKTKPELIRVSQWHHVAGVRDQSSNKLFVYVDGAMRASAPAHGEPVGTQAGLNIGRSPMKKWFFQGRIDDVRIYNRALSEDEIRGLFERGSKK